MAERAVKAPKLKQYEDDLQISLMEWAGWNEKRLPGINLIFHVANGGSRHKAEAARLKAMGVKAGVPDLCLPVPMGGYKGLYIELKTERGKPRPEQEWWINELGKNGYLARFCYGLEPAKTLISDYLSGRMERRL